MEAKTLTKQCDWDTDGMGSFTAFLPIVNQQVEFLFIAENHHSPKITDKMAFCYNEVIQIGSNQLEQIKDLLFDICNFSYELTDYGFEPNDGETHLSMNQRSFGVYTKEDSYAKSVFQKVLISNEYNKGDEHANRYALIGFEDASQNLVDVIVKNGNVIDIDDNGTYLGWFEEDENYAQKKRNDISKAP